MSTTVLPAQTATAIALARGDTISVINTTGSQVVDAWMVVPPSASEHLSMEHTRTGLSKINPGRGDELYGNRRRVLAVFSEDTSPGVHDTLIAACDPERYRLLGVSGEHANCADNYRRALAGIAITTEFVPAPLNLFMNVPWDDDGHLDFRPTVAAPGDRVSLRAVVDVVVVLSACPMDVNAINGHRPSDVEIEVRRAPATPEAKRRNHTRR